METSPNHLKNAAPEFNVSYPSMNGGIAGLLKVPDCIAACERGKVTSKLLVEKQLSNFLRIQRTTICKLAKDNVESLEK